MPYSLIHCKTIRTGIHKGNPLVPLGKQLGVQLFFACSFPCLPQGGYRGPNPAGPLNALCFLSVITERKCLRGTSAERLYFLKRRTDCHGAKAPLNDRGVRIAAGLKLLAMTGAGNVLPHALRRSRLSARSVLLLRRGVHRTPAPQ